MTVITHKTTFTFKLHTSLELFYIELYFILKLFYFEHMYRILIYTELYFFAYENQTSNK